VIRRISRGIVSTIAGTGALGYGGDNGPALAAELGGPSGLAVDSNGNIYFSDLYNNCVRKISNGIITTVAGNGTAGFAGDNGPASSALLNLPRGLAVDSAGDIYVADSGNYRIREISHGVITTVVGNGVQGGSLGLGGPATSASLSGAFSVTVDASGNLYLGSPQYLLLEVENEIITVIAGKGTAGFSGDGGPPLVANMDPRFASIDAQGNLFVSDGQNHRIRRISNGIVDTVVGTDITSLGGNNLPALNAQFWAASGVALGTAGDLYFGTGSNVVLHDSAGVIEALAGDGVAGFGGDNGPAISAQLNGTVGVALDSEGNFYVSDFENNRVRKITNGLITTVAGNGRCAFSGDNGPAANAELCAPWGVAVDSSNNLYIADSGNGRIRKVSNGVISTIAGNGLSGYSPDNTPALNADLLPVAVAVDAVGNIFCNDANRIRKISNGIITTVAGNGNYGSSGDNGPALNATFTSPQGIAIDASDNLFIADNQTRLVSKISNGIITTIAGGGGGSGEGSAGVDYFIDYPEGIAVDQAGKIYVTDVSRVLVLVPAVSNCNYTVSPTSLSVPIAGGTFTIGVRPAPGCPWEEFGVPDWIGLTASASNPTSASLTLAVAANPGAARATKVSVAGKPIEVSQAGPRSPLR
jgi:sugar lactone lactonase YvrE